MFMFNLDFVQILLTFAAAFSSYVLYTCTWRLFFCPIANFPGPKLAALTYWYEFYYDVILRGQFIWQIQALHKKYGPIIRINPHELHVIDSQFYHQLMTPGWGHVRDRDIWHTNAIGVYGAVVESPAHGLHKQRRAALNPFFSMTSIRTILPLIEEKLDVVIRRMKGFKDTGNVVNLVHAMSSLSNDVVEEFCFGSSHDRVHAEGFDPTCHQEVIALSNSVSTFRQFPAVPYILLHVVPLRFLSLCGDQLRRIANQWMACRSSIEHIKNSRSSGDAGSQTIFGALLESNLPDSEKSTQRLVSEGVTIVAAGSSTVTWTISVAMFYILSDPAILNRLREELASAPRQKNGLITNSVPVLEKLPYLTAAIKEGLRLSYGVSTRMPRVAPNEELQYGQWTIPRGTSVSMTSVFIHHDETIFPDSHKFDPDRWLRPSEVKLDKYLVAFSAGPRICLGMNLAWAELYLGMSRLIDDFNGEDCQLVLWETGIEDVKIDHDAFIPKPIHGSLGVQLKVTS